MRGLIASVRAADLDRISAYGIRPAIDRCYPLADTASAVRQVVDGGVRGKVVVTITRG